MKISIITVCYNSAATISDTLRSVREQTFAEVEHIVVDGGSTDGTVDILRGHEAGLRSWSSEPDAGIYDAMNKGIARAEGEIIGFLNADDIYADNRVLEKVAAVFADPAVDACFSDLVYVAPDDLDKVVRYWRSCEYRDGLFGKGWCPPHPTFFVRKSVYKRFGGFELDYVVANDVELMMRFLAKYKVRSKYIPDVMVKMRTGGVSNRSFAGIVRQNIEIIKAARGNGISISPLTFLFSKIVSRANQYRIRPGNDS